MSRRVLIFIPGMTLILALVVSSMSCRTPGKTDSAKHGLRIPTQAKAFIALQPQTFIHDLKRHLPMLEVGFAREPGSAKAMTWANKIINSPEVQKIESIQWALGEGGDFLGMTILGSFDSQKLASMLAGLSPKWNSVPGANPPRWQNNAKKMIAMGKGHLALTETKALSSNEATGFLATALQYLNPDADILYMGPNTNRSSPFQSYGLSFVMGELFEMTVFFDAPEKILPMLDHQLIQMKNAWPVLRARLAQKLDGIKGPMAPVVAPMKEEVLTLLEEIISSCTIEPVEGGLVLTAQSNVGRQTSTVTITSLLAIVGIPAFVKYRRRAKTSEAIDELDKIYKGAAVYFMNQRIGRDGSKLPCQFPAPTVMIPPLGPNGEHPCCSSKYDTDGNGRCDVFPGSWNTPTWAALSFMMTDQHQYAYAFDSSGTLSDAKMTATAYGDLDCDGVWSTFQKLAYGDPQATMSECSIRGAAALYVENETE